MAIQRHLIAFPTDDGGLELHPLKEWLRQHNEHVPPGLDASGSTSHQLRAGLIKGGWTSQESPTEFRLFPPGTSASAPGGLDDAEDDEEAADSFASFSLESQLRDFLAANIATVPVNGKRLRVFVDETGRDGIEYSTPVGRIDLLAVDDVGDFYVFELKRATSSDRALGQLARYMGWMRHTIGKQKKVSGIIVSKLVAGEMRYARSVIPDVYLFEYQVSFSLRAAHDLPEP